MYHLPAQYFYDIISVRGDYNMYLENFLAACFMQLLAMCAALVVSYYTQNMIAKREAKTKAKEYASKKYAYGTLFSLIIKDYEKYLKHLRPGPWQSYLWFHQQHVLAEYYPSETSQFAQVIMAVEYGEHPNKLPGLPCYDDSLKDLSLIIISIEEQQKLLHK